YIDYELKRKVVEYNKSGDTYRIVVKEYNTYNTSEDYTLGVKQLNNDIISGGMPDISGRGQQYVNGQLYCQGTGGKCG
ncbi:hypothetical protein LEA_08253, partial [human gut metagenome]